ncbi:MAG: DUF1540 domain-containing protein [Lachnospiraceae bacterium]
MSCLQCSVATCVHNSEHRCCKNEIIVEGAKARSIPETCCGSFDERRGETFKNQFETPNTTAKISCEVCNCIYNKEHVCQAERVDIAGNGASAATQTECSTFRQK